MKKKYFLFLVVFYLFCFRSMALLDNLSDDSLKTSKIKPEYAVSLLEGINSKKSEFCVVPYLNQLLFVADQPKDLINNESFDINGNPYVDVFSTDLVNGRVGKAIPFSKNINGPYHDGPLSFNQEQTQLYLTRVEYINKKTKSFVNRAKLFVFQKKEKGWSDPISFKYNDDSYSIGHASVSKDGLSLFFASDMPGGKGGKDIYVCKKNGNEWDKPQNLGPEINTEGDDEFPYIRDDGQLFFSSNGHMGFGGFDIFSAFLINEEWQFNRNEGSGINSEADDFGIVFTDSIHGYFTSNRKSGIGLDDIYQFTFTSNAINILATLLLTQDLKDPAKDALVYLMNYKGKIIDSTRTNQKGFFQFRNLYGEGEKHYMAYVDPDDIEMNGKARFYLANTNGSIVRASRTLKKHQFVFDNLPLDNSSLQEIYNDEELSLSGVLSYSNNPILFVKNAELYLINTFGDVVDTAKTNELGCFVFKNFISDQDYIVSINDSTLHLPVGTVITLSDKKGKKLKDFVVGKDEFKFKLLSHEKVVLSELATDEELSFSFNNCSYGQNKLDLKAIANKKVYLLDSKGKMIDSLMTNKKGLFKFKNLDVDKDYLVSVEESDLSLTIKKQYYLTSAKGDVVKVSYPFKNQKFVFKNISLDSLSLQEMVIDDHLFLAGNLRFGALGKDPIKNTRVYLVNATGTAVDSVVTNEYGCFSFRNISADQNYMMNIHEADMNLPFNTKVFLTDKNGKVTKVFFTGKDKFEYKVLTVEKNLMPDLETYDEELTVKLNGYVYGQNKKVISHATVMIYDSFGKQVQSVITDNTGKFSFNNIKTDMPDRIEVVLENLADSVLFIADGKGIIKKQLQKNSNGTFDYKLLDMDKSMLGDFELDDPWLKVIDMQNDHESLTIVESIFYKINDFKFDSIGQKILDKTINVLKANSKLIMELSSHTDSRSDDTYNLKLSNRRAQFAVDYIISKGIDKSRLKAIGYGETRLLNKCVNDFNCSESEHAQNRRTEFKITYNKKTR